MVAGPCQRRQDEVIGLDGAGRDYDIFGREGRAVGAVDFGEVGAQLQGAFEVAVGEGEIRVDGRRRGVGDELLELVQGEGRGVGSC
jgi:hypothetical protein